MMYSYQINDFKDTNNITAQLGFVVYTKPDISITLSGITDLP